MAAINGLRGTGDWGTDERPKNFRETILWRQPNGMTPITGMLSKIASEKTTDPEFAWWEEELNTLTITETTGLAANAGSTTVNASGGGCFQFVPGDLLLVDKVDQVTFDNEIIEVVTVTTDILMTVARAAAGTTVAGIAVSTKLTKIGNVFAEGTGAPTASTRNPTKLFNYCQIFKTIYDVTETVMETKARTGPVLTNDKKRKMFDHSLALEWSFLMGRRSETTGSNGKPKRTTGGVRSFLSTNVTVFTTTATEQTFLDATYPVWNFQSKGGDERIAFAGNVAINTLNQLAKNSASSRVVFQETVKVYGMSLQKWVLPQGTLFLKSHPLLNNHTRYNSSMFIFDFSSIKYRFVRDTFFKDNVQANDEDRKKGMWLSEVGLEFEHEKTMGYLGKLTNP
jgi:hypothetical protein